MGMTHDMQPVPGLDLVACTQCGRVQRWDTPTACSGPGWPPPGDAQQEARRLLVLEECREGCREEYREEVKPA